MKNKLKIRDVVYIVGVSAFSGGVDRIGEIGKILSYNNFIGVDEIIYCVKFKNKNINYYREENLIKIG